MQSEVISRCEQRDKRVNLIKKESLHTEIPMGSFNVIIEELNETLAA